MGGGEQNILRTEEKRNNTSQIKKSGLTKGKENEIMGSVAQREHPFSTCLCDLYNHSWSLKTERWLRVPRGSALVAAELGLGYLAKKEEIKRFGSKAKRVVKINKRVDRDKRLFVEVVYGKMSWRDGQSSSTAFNPGGRSFNRWDEERNKREEGEFRRMNYNQ